jgi:hypothetical protein
MEVVRLFYRLTSVKRPITADGLTRNTLPLPLLVFIPALKLPVHPPVHTPPVQVCPGAQSPLPVHEKRHEPRVLVLGLPPTQVATWPAGPIRFEQSLLTKQLPAAQFVVPVIWPLLLSTQCVEPEFP